MVGINESNSATITTADMLKRKCIEENITNDLNIKKPKVEREHPELLDMVAAVAAVERIEKSGGNWQCWSHEEEVFLVGAVMERFFARGSLSSTKKEAKERNRKNCWDTIKKIYDDSFEKYSKAIGINCPPKRTENALSRHYKVMKERSLGKTNKNAVDFKSLYDEWHTNYSKKHKLIDEPDYSALLAKPKTENNSKESVGEISIPSQSRGRWNFSDEVILIGVVIETFFKRGSLSSSHKERKKNEKDFWQNLHSTYEKVKAKYSQAHGLTAGKVSRSSQALARHFKVMKVKLIESKGEMNLKSFYKEWEVKFRKYYLTLDAPTPKVEIVEEKKSVNAHQLEALKYFHETINAQQAAVELEAQTSQFLPQKKVYVPNANNIPSSNSGAAMLANLRQTLPGVPGLDGMSVNGMTPFPFNRNISMNSLFSGLTAPRSPGVALQAINAYGNEGHSVCETYGSLPTPNGEFDMKHVKDLFGPISASTMTTPSGQSVGGVMMSHAPTPVVTTQGNATTYWLPVTLYHDQNNPKPANPQQGSASAINGKTEK